MALDAHKNVSPILMLDASSTITVSKNNWSNLSSYAVNTDVIIILAFFNNTSCVSFIKSINVYLGIVPFSLNNDSYFIYNFSY